MVVEVDMVNGYLDIAVSPVYVRCAYRYLLTNRTRVARRWSSVTAKFHFLHCRIPAQVLLYS